MCQCLAHHYLLLLLLLLLLPCCHTQSDITQALEEIIAQPQDALATMATTGQLEGVSQTGHEVLVATRVSSVVYLEDTEEAKKARAIAKADAELLGSVDDQGTAVPSHAFESATVRLIASGSRSWPQVVLCLLGLSFCLAVCVCWSCLVSRLLIWAAFVWFRGEQSLKTRKLTPTSGSCSKRRRTRAL